MAEVNKNPLGLTYHIYKHAVRTRAANQRRIKAYNEGTEEYQQKVRDRVAKTEEKRLRKMEKRKNAN